MRKTDGRFSMDDPVERLWAKIDRRGDDECWPYKGSVTSYGYGQFWLNGKNISAHRAVMLLLKGVPLTSDWTLKHQGPARRGPIGARREVIHKCYNRICCNPKHIEYSNHSENMRDVIAAGNFKNPRQKLTPADYAAILASSEGTRALARRFNLNRCHIQDIRNGKVAGARVSS